MNVALEILEAASGALDSEVQLAYLVEVLSPQIKDIYQYTI